MTVAEERSFTRAARRLHISQPPLTRQIRMLEEELGITLFNRRRTRNGVEVTRDGGALLDAARSILQSIADFEGRTQAIRARGLPTVTVGIDWGLWPALNLIRERHAARFPGAAITARDLRHEDTGGRFHELFDVALIRPPVDPQLASQPLFEERFVVLLGSRHSLAARHSLRLSDLAKEPLLLFERALAPSIYDMILTLRQGVGPSATVIEHQPAPHEAAAMMLVASCQGYYLSIASRFTQSHRTSGISAIPLNASGATSHVHLAWRATDGSVAVREFIRSARSVFSVARVPSRFRRDRRET